MDIFASRISAEKKIYAMRQLIVEMIDASMQKALEKGPHSLQPGCNCIACVNRRKRILTGSPDNWKYRL
ncbi:MAG: hypothetical protein KGY38_08115 [Desulfobacterales bacterium]|nr:hypothetical protein [Desulfobacterales bacterium]